MLPVEILKKLSEEMDATLQQAKSACAEGLALTTQQLTDDECHAAVVATIQETAIVIEQFQQALRRALGRLAPPEIFELSVGKKGPGLRAPTSLLAACIAGDIPAVSGSGVSESRQETNPLRCSRRRRTGTAFLNDSPPALRRN